MARTRKISTRKQSRKPKKVSSKEVVCISCGNPKTNHSRFRHRFLLKRTPEDQKNHDNQVMEENLKKSIKALRNKMKGSKTPKDKDHRDNKKMRTLKKSLRDLKKRLMDEHKARYPQYYDNLEKRRKIEGR